MSPWNTLLSRPRRTRRLLAPEVVQSSAMDCGPASLKCLFEGFGVRVSYDRLREACQTSLDGTSIDTLEQIAVRLGLDAEQVMLPLDHLLLPETGALPALLVVTNSMGMTHFLVVWRRHGSWVQVMDPAIGRRWLPVHRLLAETFVHRLRVPSEAWRAWAGSGEFMDGLSARCRALGLERAERERLAREAAADPGWRSFAALDASVRMTAALVESGGLRPGKEAAAVICHGFEKGREGNAPETIPAIHWSVTTVEGFPDELLLRGAVLLRIRGRLPATTVAPDAEELPAELRAALTEPSCRPNRQLLDLLRSDGLLSPLALAVALAVAAGAAVLEALFFRGLLDLVGELHLLEQRLAAAAALLGFFVLLLLLELAIVAQTNALGRRLEVRLRRRFLERIVGLSDRYFQSRLSSDMAERSHNTFRLRLYPEIAMNLLRSAFQVVLTAVGIAWIDPAVAPVAGLAALFALALPLATQAALTERDLRLRNHAGALGRFYLDALLGLVPVRNHGAALPLRREHESLLLEQTRAGRSRESIAVVLDVFQAVVSYGLAALVVFRHVAGARDHSQTLLVSFWALQIGYLGQQMGLAAKQYPLLRNTVARLLEPLRAEEDEKPAAGGESAERTDGPQGLEVRYEGARVVAGGHVILDAVDLVLEAGSRVAIVGPSGAGKSTLVGLLLGWHAPAAGRILVDGLPLDAERLAGLRRQTAWVDPAVQLWNVPLFDNLLYGSTADGDGLLGRSVEASDLRPTLEDLPMGLQSPLGEGGGLVSGGEGQRVRLGRALMRPEARLVILDEPFRGLDRTARHRLLDRARSWWPGATLICVTHDIEQTRSFDRVVVVEGGRVAELGCPRELAARPDSRYRELLDRESRIRQRFGQGAGWRRQRLVAGRLIEETEGLENG